MTQAKGLFSIGLRDVFNGALVFAGTNLIAGLIQLLSNQHFPTWPEFQPVLITAFSAFLTYLAKNLLTNSQGNFAQTETPKEIAIVQKAKDEIAVIKQEEKDAKKP